MLQLAIDKDKAEKEQAEKEQAEKEQAEKDKAVNGSVVTPAVKQGNVQDVAAGKAENLEKSEVPSISAASKATQSDTIKASNAEMPKTGEKETTFVAILGMLLVSMIAAFSFKRGKHQ